MIDRQLVRADEHAGAEGLQQLARRIELEDRVDARRSAPPHVVPPAPELPQRSTTQIVPSGAVVTLAVEPHLRPGGS